MLLLHYFQNKKTDERDESFSFKSKHEEKLEWSLKFFC